MTRLAPLGVCGPLLGQVKATVQGRVSLRGHVGQEDAELAVVDLAQAAAPLAGHAAAVAPLLGEAGRVDDDYAVGLGQLRADVPAQLGHDGLVIPGPTADEVLEVLARDAGLPGDRLGALAFQAAEQATDEGRGVPALLLPVEPGQVALQEAREVVTEAPDVFRQDHGVGEQGLSFGVIKERHGGVSIRGCPMPPIITPMPDKMFGKLLQ